LPEGSGEPYLLKPYSTLSVSEFSTTAFCGSIVSTALE
jgi:hypothetical protein